MRVRKDTVSDPATGLGGGDMMFGNSLRDYWYNSPYGVGQLVQSRLLLWLGQWYLNVPDGTPYYQEVLGFRTTDTRDAAIRLRIFGTPGVLTIDGYNSQFDQQGRMFDVHATIQTRYGTYVFQNNIKSAYYAPSDNPSLLLLNL